VSCAFICVCEFLCISTNENTLLEYKKEECVRSTSPLIHSPKLRKFSPDVTTNNRHRLTLFNIDVRPFLLVHQYGLHFALVCFFLIKLLSLIQNSEGLTS